MDLSKTIFLYNPVVFRFQVGLFPGRLAKTPAGDWLPTPVLAHRVRIAPRGDHYEPGGNFFLDEERSGTDGCDKESLKGEVYI